MLEAETLVLIREIVIYGERGDPQVIVLTGLVAEESLAVADI